VRPLGFEVARLESRRADRVRVTAHEHRDGHLGLDLQPLFERVTDAPHHALIVGADRALRQRGDLVRKLLGALQGKTARNDLVNEADARGLVGAALYAPAEAVTSMGRGAAEVKPLWQRIFSSVPLMAVFGWALGLI
jgi:hypothetical protein